MQIVKNANMALAFLLELGVLAALIYWGFSTESPLLVKIVLGIGAPVVAVLVWAILGAPNSARRLTGIWYWLLRIGFDAVGGGALFVANQPALGAIFVVVAAINCVLALLWKQ